MTNHPRRAGRRKLQRRTARWIDLTSSIASVQLGNGRPWTPAYVGVAPTNRQHLVHVHRQANGRIDVHDDRPIRRTLDLDLREPA